LPDQTSPSPAAQQVVDGKLRGLAVTSKERSRALPDVPTTAAAGYPAIAGDNWQGIVVPAGTPKEVIAFLYRELVAIMRLPEVTERLAALVFEPVASTSEDFARHARVEFEKWAQVIKDTNIKAQ
jgi:tripartite-type tricarboxylate transporter receptor subunit TctC